MSRKRLNHDSNEDFISECIAWEQVSSVHNRMRSMKNNHHSLLLSYSDISEAAINILAGIYTVKKDDLLNSYVIR